MTVEKIRNHYFFNHPGDVFLQDGAFKDFGVGRQSEDEAARAEDGANVRLQEPHFLAVMLGRLDLGYVFRGEGVFLQEEVLREKGEADLDVLEVFVGAHPEDVGGFLAVQGLVLPRVVEDFDASYAADGEGLAHPGGGLEGVDAGVVDGE